MKRFSIARLNEVAKDRKPGYLDAVMAAASSVTDTHVEMDDASYRRIRRQYATRILVKAKKNGPGFILKSMLESMGIKASKTCKCNKMARQMDDWGPEESMRHIEEIVDVMQETAKKRGLPFVRTAGRAMVRLACWRAKRSK